MPFKQSISDRHIHDNEGSANSAMLLFSVRFGAEGRHTKKIVLLLPAPPQRPAEQMLKRVLPTAA